MDSTTNRNKGTTQGGSDPPGSEGMEVVVRASSSSLTDDRTLSGVSTRASEATNTSGSTTTRQSQRDKEKTVRDKQKIRQRTDASIERVRTNPQVSLTRIQPGEQKLKGRQPLTTEELGLEPTNPFKGRNSLSRSPPPPGNRERVVREANPQLQEPVTEAAETNEGKDWVQEQNKAAAIFGKARQEAIKEIEERYVKTASLYEIAGLSHEQATHFLERESAFYKYIKEKLADTRQLRNYRLLANKSTYAEDEDDVVFIKPAIPTIRRIDAACQTDRPAERSVLTQCQLRTETRTLSVECNLEKESKTASTQCNLEATAMVHTGISPAEQYPQEERANADGEISRERCIINGMMQVISLMAPGLDQAKKHTLSQLVEGIVDIVVEGGNNTTAMEVTEEEFCEVGNRRQKKRKWNFSPGVEEKLGRKDKKEREDKNGGRKAAWSNIVKNNHGKLSDDGGDITKGPTPSIDKARQEVPRTKNKVLTRKPRTEAIIVPVKEGTSYLEVAKRIRGGLGAECQGFRRLRQTRGGHILLELERKADAGEIYRSVQGAFPDSAGVKRLRPTISLEFRDIDPTVEAEEIFTALEREVPCKPGDPTPTARIRKGPMGTLVASVVCGETQGRDILKKGRLKLGLTNSSVRHIPRVTRCFACHDIGHFAKDCSYNKDGREICRRCGERDHHMSTCNAPYKCISCERAGRRGNLAAHLTGGTRCPVYRMAIAGGLRPG